MSLCGTCIHSGSCDDEADGVLDCGDYEKDTHFIPATTYATENHSIEGKEE